MENPKIMKVYLLLLLALTRCLPLFSQNIELSLLSRYDHGLPAGGEVEIVAPFDPVSQRLFVNLQKDKITIIDLSAPSVPDSIGSIDLAPYGTLALNVAVKNSLVAVATQGPTKQDSGLVIIFDTNGVYINDITVGPAPGMLSFTPNGRYIVVANEGVPTDDYLNDPEGSISIIDLLNGPSSPLVNHIDFSDYNIGSVKESSFPSSVHVYGPGASRAQDLEPEFVAIGSNGEKAYVSLQENNTVLVLDIPMGTIDTLFFLGYKDHSMAGNELDASDQDGAANILSWPVYGMYQPDGMAAFSKGGMDYFITANEGAARKYSAFNEEKRVSNLLLDTNDFSNISYLQGPTTIGRLKVTTVFGDTEQDGDMNSLYCYGGRSFSIWNASTGDLVYDSGDEFEQKISLIAPGIFNSAGTAGTFDSRSDNKGPEPEDVVVGTIGSRDYAFIGLEQVGGIIVYDITDPTAPEFISYEPAAPGDVGPEASVFIGSQESPIGQPLLVVSHEASSTLAIYVISTSNSISENTTGNITLYPNPAADEVKLIVEDCESENLWYQLYDMQGKLLASKKITGTVNTVIMESLPTSAYFLKVMDHQEVLRVFNIIKN